jgi:hypothetical protein
MGRDELCYTSSGYLAGRTPNGRDVVAGHPQSGRTGFEVHSSGRIFTRYGQEQLYQDFGVAPQEKQTGGQAGYPSEPVLRALWRYFVDRYNSGDTRVRFTRTPP